MLIMRKDLIASTWPLLSPYEDSPIGIAKFDGWNLGTINSAAQSAIDPAIDFHNSLGTTVIHDRLRTLTRYWTERTSDIPGLRLHTPRNSPSIGAVSLFSIEGKDARKIERALAERGVRVRYRQVKELEGVRVSPHIYTSTEELDHFVAALRAVSKTI
jgi:selenocysteine lyase/cysteine desulfurase